MSIMQSPLTLKLSAFVALSETDLQTLERYHRRRRIFQANHELIHEGQKNHSAFILAEGWACSFKVLPDGERQIVDFQLPGDFLGLRSILFRTADHSTEAVTRIEASEVLATDIFDSFAEAPKTSNCSSFGPPLGTKPMVVEASCQPWPPLCRRTHGAFPAGNWVRA